MEAGTQDFKSSDLDVKFEKFFKEHYMKNILDVVRGYPETRSLTINFDDLDRFDIALADELINHPGQVIAFAEKTLREMDLPEDLPSVKINVRFENLPPTSKRIIRDLRSKDIGKFVVIESIVRKSNDVKPKILVGAYKCQLCGTVAHITQEEEKLKEPYECDSCEERRPFKLLVEDSVFIDSQEIVIGESGESLKVHLEDDLTGKITLKDRIEVAGILKIGDRRKPKKVTILFDWFLKANSVRPSNSKLIDQNIQCKGG